MGYIKEKQERPIPNGLKRWPLKLIKDLADTTCASQSSAGPAGWYPLTYELSSKVLSKTSKWVMHTLVKAESKFCMQLP